MKGEPSFLDTPVEDMDAALAMFQRDPLNAWRNVMSWDPGCDTEQSVLVWNSGVVGDCRSITWGELFVMLRQLGKKAQVSVKSLCSLSTQGCTKPVVTRAKIEDSKCTNRRWELEVRIFFKCTKP